MQRTKIRSLLIAVLITLSFLSQLPISTVYASNPTLVNSVANSSNVSPLGSMSLSVTAGDFLIVAVQWQYFGSINCQESSVSDGVNSWTKVRAALCNVAGSDTLGVQIFYTTAATTATLALSISATIGGVGATIAAQAYDYSAATTAGFNGVSLIGTGTGNSATPQTNSLNWGDATWIALATVYAEAGGAGTAPPNMALKYDTVPVRCSQPCSSARASSGGALSPPSSFVFGNFNSGQWVEESAIFGIQTTSIVTVINGCTFFQLQCWWYPLFFMMLYAGVLMLVATQLNTSSRGKAHIFLSAVTFGSLIAVILGIMNIVFPLLMLVINTIIALRLRG